MDITKKVSRKKFTVRSSPASARPKLPPPPPPPTADSTEQKCTASAKDLPRSESHEDYTKRRRKSKNEDKSQPQTSEEAQGKRRSSDKKKEKKRRSSNASSKFYVSLESECNGEASPRDDDKGNTAASPETSQSVTNGADCRGAGDSKRKVDGKDNESWKGKENRKPRKLPTVPTDTSPARPPEPQPQPKVTPEDGTKADVSQTDQRGGEVNSIKTKQPSQNYTKKYTVSENSNPASHPAAPICKKRRHRIITQDVTHMQVMAATNLENSDSENTSLGSVGTLESFLTDSEKEEDSKMTNSTPGDKKTKELENLQPKTTPPIPRKPKPQILRPKPKISVPRHQVISFTTEDMDICQVGSRPSDASNMSSGSKGLSKKDRMPARDRTGERSSRRRSQSVEGMSTDHMVRQSTKPPVPIKPRFTKNLLFTEPFCDPTSITTPPRRRRQLPQPPEPKDLISSDLNSSEQCVADAQSKTGLEKTTETADGSTETANLSSHLDDVSMENRSPNQQQSKSSEKVSRKVSTKKAEFKRKQSFRTRVYDDVELKDEFMEGKEEDLNFSGSEDNENMSDESMTDEEDLQFEKEQAELLGLSPKQNEDSQTSSPVCEQPKDKLHQIAKELVDTEKAYVNKLHLIHQIFHFRVIRENREEHFLPENLIPQIFINIGSIYQFHDFLLKQLEERMQQWESIRRVGDILLKWAPFLKLYAEYINRFDNAMDTFNMCMEKYPRFASIVEEIQASPECGMLMLQHHMLEPIQRVPRYELLLKDYLKYLPDDSPDRDDTTKALSVIAQAAAHANETIKKNEHSQKLLTISESLIGSSNLNLISPTRRLIKEGSIIKISARDGSHQERYLFLFNDYLLVCVPVTLPKLVKHQYKIKNKLDIEGMIVLEGDDLYTPNTFRVKSKTRSIEFHTNTLEEKDAWQIALWSVISEYTKNKMSHVPGTSLTDAFEKEELGKRAPTWVKDQATSMCMICAREFRAFFRRHHCRACGRVICGLCSSRKAPLEYDGGTPKRVCDVCYNILELKLDPEIVKFKGMTRRDKTLRGVKASDPSIISGYLLMSQNKKTWEKRFFSVRDDFVLYSFKAHEDVFALTSMPLPGYVMGQAKDENQLKGKHVFKLFHIGLKKEYYFQTDDKTSLNRWMSVLEKLIRAELPADVVSASPQTTPTSTGQTIQLTA